MFFLYSPISWDDDPIWLSYFSGGWNHQLDVEEGGDVFVVPFIDMMG